MLLIVFGDVNGAANERRERDEMLLGRLLGGGELVPFDCQGVSEVRLGQRKTDDFLGCWVSKRTSVEVDLIVA